jgi:hypothetical protein
MTDTLMTNTMGSRLPRYRNPLRMFFSTGPAAATAYLFSYIPVGAVMFAIVLAAVVVSGTLSIIWIGLPLLVGAAVIVRGCAEVERWRALMVIDPVPSSYRMVSQPGLFAQIRTRWSDPTTIRDCAYILLLFVPLLVLDVVALVIWLTFLAGITVPLWYWSIPQGFHDGQHLHGLMMGYLPSPHTVIVLNGHDGFGVWVGDLPTALAVAAVFFVLSLLGTYVVVGAARLHAAIVRSVLGPPVDPLAAAKRMLAEPGPLLP